MQVSIIGLESSIRYCKCLQRLAQIPYNVSYQSYCFFSLKHWTLWNIPSSLIVEGMGKHGWVSGLSFAQTCPVVVHVYDGIKSSGWFHNNSPIHENSSGEEGAAVAAVLIKYQLDGIGLTWCCGKAGVWWRFRLSNGCLIMITVSDNRFLYCIWIQLGDFTGMD